MGKRGDLGSAHGDGDDRDGSDELAQSVEHQLALPCDELLEEALDADLLLIVVDLADPDWQGQLKTVHQQLDSLGSQSLRRVVANQIDRCELSAVEAIRDQEPDCLFLSAMRGDGLQGLRQWLRWQFFSNTSESRRTEGDEAQEWMS